MRLIYKINEFAIIFFWWNKFRTSRNKGASRWRKKRKFFVGKRKDDGWPLSVELSWNASYRYHLIVRSPCDCWFVGWIVNRESNYGREMVCTAARRKLRYKVEREREASYADRVTCKVTRSLVKTRSIPPLYTILRIACENRSRVIQWERFTLANRFVGLQNYTRGW